MKIINKITKIGLILLGIGIILGLIASVTLKQSFFEVISYNSPHQKTTSSKKQEGIIPNENIAEIELNFEVSEINIKHTDDNKIAYEYHSTQENELRVEIEERTLSLENNVGSTDLFGFDAKSSTFILYLPKSKKYDLEIKTKVASTIISDVSLSSLDINSDVGEVSLTNIKILDELKVISNVGAIEITNLREPKEVELENNVGEIKIKNMYTKKVEIESNVGTISFINDDLDYKITYLSINSKTGNKTIKVGQ
ncbi:DUF4097 domain-containing protein [Erysipelotrichaceae bacterium OttesenSCG-928-M19]|nr:DUF4097 domain-containing protein [Erysipelotrichaceae bacterium OttesenSCG-928-M19]